MYSGVPKTAKPRIARSLSVAGFWSLPVSAVATPKSRSFTCGSPAPVSIRFCGLRSRCTRPAACAASSARAASIAMRTASRHERSAAPHARVERLAGAAAPSRGRRARRATCRSRRAARGCGARGSRRRAPRDGSARARPAKPRARAPRIFTRELASELDVLRLVDDAARALAELAPDAVRASRRAARGRRAPCASRGPRSRGRPRASAPEPPGASRGPRAAGARTRCAIAPARAARACASAGDPRADAALVALDERAPTTGASPGRCTARPRARVALVGVVRSSASR